MAGSGLDTELRRSAERAAESILSAARADAERLASDADRLIRDRRREVKKDKEAEYRAEARVVIAAERHAAMRAVLLARTRVINRVFERARALLPGAAETDAYVSALGSELTEALQFVDNDGAVVRCSVDLVPAVQDALRGRPEVTIEPEADFGTGFVVVGGGGSVLVDGRLETRIESLASALAIEIRTHLQEL